MGWICVLPELGQFDTIIRLNLKDHFILFVELKWSHWSISFDYNEMCPSCSIEGCGSDVLDAVVVVIWLQNNTLGIN